MTIGASFFKEFPAAIREANHRAFLTGRRQRVYYDILNHWWTVIQEGRRIKRMEDGS
jgi:hypothetical protein